MIVTFEGKDGKEIRGEVILSEPRLKRLANRLKRVDEFAFDTETNTLRVTHEGEMELVGISICFGEEDGYYIPTGHYFDEGQLDTDLVVKYLRPAFERKDVRIIGHNLKFDLHVLANVNINLKTTDIFDTMIARWITNENKAKGLKPMTSELYGINQSSFDSCLATVTNEEKKAYGLKSNNKAPFHLVRVPVASAYAIADAYWTWRHYVDWQLDEIVNEEMKTIYYKGMMPFLTTLFKMERRGIRIDVDRLKKMQVQAEKDLADLEYQIIELAGVQFNIGSGQQLTEILFGYMKYNKKGEYSGNENLVKASFNFPVQGETKGGAPSTGDGALTPLSKMTYKKDKRKQEGVEMIKLILKYKRLAKLKSAFIDGLIEQSYKDNKIHPSFNIAGTDSGRLSCSNPNLQQLPRPIELPNEPLRDKFDSEEDYEKAVKKYNKAMKDLEMWKFYEIRDVFIPDNPEEEVIIAVDYVIVHYKPCELLEVPKVA